MNKKILFLLSLFRRLITHTSKLLEEKQENLCVKILQTLREMLAVDTEYGEKVITTLLGNPQFCHIHH
jgi:hypothetical protein